MLLCAPEACREVADPAAFDTQEEDPDGDYFARKQWEGPRPGFCFKLGDKGVGYYKDVPYHISQAAAEKAALKLSAPTLANWFYELLQAPPSVKKADRFYELFQLDVLRVVGLSASHQTLTLIHIIIHISCSIVRVRQLLKYFPMRKT